MARSIFFIVIIGTLIQGFSFKKYENHTLVKYLTSNDDQLLAALTFNDPDNEVMILKSSRGINDTLDVLLPFSKQQFMTDFANEVGLTPIVKIEHYGSFLDDGREPRRRSERHFGIYKYNSYTAVQEFLNFIMAHHRDIVSLQTVGKSFEGRMMKLVRISKQPDAGNPIIFIDAGIHAREWVAPAMAMYLINRLASDPAIRRPGGELDGVDWYILPVTNPDGYEYSRTTDRMWRKTRSKSTNGCYGVDGNRNYGFKWGVSGVSFNPCDSETYAGPNAFSEPETQVVRDIILNNVNRIKLYVSLHSYGQYLVYPWGYTGSFLPDGWQKLHNLGEAVSQKVQQAGGKPFRVMSAGKWYAAAGGSDDYAFSNGVPYSYTMELTNGFDFIFPEHHLNDVLPKFFEGFRVFAQQIQNEFGRKGK